jgi:hypothetical protein
MNRWFKKTEPPLTGVPAVRRQKTYSASSGYVYQYHYAGHRSLDQAVEYVFSVSADRKTSFDVSVLVPDAALESWQRERQRELTSTERYAIAKMALFQAFDERETPEQMREQVAVRPADAAQILTTLGLD